MKSLLFTYILTYGGALASFYRPFYGFLIYVMFAIMKPDLLWWYTVPEGNYSRTIAIALIAGWALHGCGDWQFGRGKALIVALVGFLAWAGGMTMWAESRDLAMPYIEDLAKIVLPAFVGLTLLDSPKRLQQLAWAILLAVGYLALEMNLSYLQGYNRIREEGFGGLDNNGVAIIFDSCVGLSLFLGLAARTWWSKSISLGISLLLIHGVFLSNSRGGMLALLVTGFISFLLLPKKPWHYALFMLILLVGVRLAGDEVQTRFATIFSREGERDASLEDRKDLLYFALDSVGKRPLMGVGPNHWNRTASLEYGIADGKATEVHNTWVQIAAELGLPGLGLLLTYYGLCVIRLLPLARSRPDGADAEAADLARMVISSVAGSLVACSFVSVESVETPYYIALLGAGVLRTAPGRGTRALPAGAYPSSVAHAARRSNSRPRPAPGAGEITNPERQVMR